MVRQARILAQATSDLVNAIKMDAEGESDLENSRKLLSAAKLLADATAKMVEAAKVGTFFCVLRRLYFFFISSDLGFLTHSSANSLCLLRAQQPTLTVRSSSRSCGKLPRVSAWPPMQLHRTPSRSGWSTSWR